MKVDMPILKVWLVSLSFIAGALNVCAIRFFAIPVTHHTGNMSQLAVTFSNENIHGLLRTMSAIGGFFLGAFIAGLLFHQRNFTLKKRYGLVFMCCALCIAITIIPVISIFIKLVLLALTAGLQNGMFMSYNNAIVRSTHVTGYLTDAAFGLGMAVRGNKTKLHFSFFYLISVLAFLLGGILFAFIPETPAVPILAGLYFATGLFYFFIRRYAERKS